MPPEPVTVDVKSTSNFESLLHSIQDGDAADKEKNKLEDKTCGVVSESPAPPDLATIEESKRTVERVAHQQESFWSLICFRACCDCCIYCPHSCNCGYCWVAPETTCCGGGGCCAGDCCAVCAEACSGCGECGVAACSGLGEGCGACTC